FHLHSCNLAAAWPMCEYAAVAGPAGGGGGSACYAAAAAQTPGDGGVGGGAGGESVRSQGAAVGAKKGRCLESGTASACRGASSAREGKVKERQDNKGQDKKEKRKWNKREGEAQVKRQKGRRSGRQS
ncbi:Protein of unknown function, partial [Gryllus bimaculatus]